MCFRMFQLCFSAIAEMCDVGKKTSTSVVDVSPSARVENTETWQHIKKYTVSLNKVSK